MVRSFQVVRGTNACVCTDREAYRALGISPHGAALSCLPRKLLHGVSDRYTVSLGRYKVGSLGEMA